MISLPLDSNFREIKEFKDRFFQTREDALEALRHDKKFDGCRYGSFSTYKEAIKFLANTTESSAYSSVPPPLPSSTLIEQEKTKVWPERQIENQSFVVSPVAPSTVVEIHAAPSSPGTISLSQIKTIDPRYNERYPGSSSQMDQKSIVDSPLLTLDSTPEEEVSPRTLGVLIMKKNVSTHVHAEPCPSILRVILFRTPLSATNLWLTLPWKF